MLINAVGDKLLIGASRNPDLVVFVQTSRKRIVDDFSTTKLLPRLKILDEKYVEKNRGYFLGFQVASFY